MFLWATVHFEHLAFVVKVFRCRIQVCHSSLPAEGRLEMLLNRLMGYHHDESTWQTLIVSLCLWLSGSRNLLSETSLFGTEKPKRHLVKRCLCRSTEPTLCHCTDLQSQILHERSSIDPVRERSSWTCHSLQVPPPAAHTSCRQQSGFRGHDRTTKVQISAHLP